MVRPRGKAQTPERAGEEIFVLSEVPESWNRLPKTQKQAKELGQSITSRASHAKTDISVRN